MKSWNIYLLYLDLLYEYLEGIPNVHTVFIFDCITLVGIPVIW